MLRFTGRTRVGYAGRADMMPHRAPALAVWLAALFVAVLGLLAPAPAAAHAGHDHAAPAGRMEAAEAVLAALAEDAAPEAGLDTAGTQAPCGGAACCTAGHGCCAALAGSAPPGIARPRTPPPAPVLAGLPAGLGAATLPEPPRPFR